MSQMAEEKTEAQSTGEKPSPGVFPDEHNKITCIKCGKKMDATTQFFSMSDGTKRRYPMCKEDLTAFIDNKDRSTFEWILEIFDVPYIDAQWKKIYNMVMDRKNKVGRSDVLGRYLRQMKMQEFSKYTYADTVRLEYSYNRQATDDASNAILSDEGAKARLAELQAQLDAGTITQAQFDTMNPMNGMVEVNKSFLEFSPSVGVDEDEIKQSLTQEDVDMLKTKWGLNYKPSQWVAMEELYSRYEDEYELDVDREETLKQICKLTIKMNEALSVDDFKSYRDLASMCNTLRASACFTTAQKKEGSGKFMDCVGQLVSFCEKEGGIIAQIPNPDDTPQDSIDYAIKNMKAYYYDLVTNELGLGNMIESYIKRLEEANKQQNIDMDAGLITSREEEDALSKQDEVNEMDEFLDSLQREAEEMETIGDEV